MLPLGHAAFAYLAFVAVALLRGRDLPNALAILPLAIGSQLPDLIDKPLAYFHVIDSGRSIGHSVFTLVLLSLVVVQLAKLGEKRFQDGSWKRRLSSITPFAFVIGYGGHLVGDIIDPLLANDFWSVRFLLWPVFFVPRFPGDDIAPWVRLARIYWDPMTHPQLELILAALLVFVLLRTTPILEYFRRSVKRRL